MSSERSTRAYTYKKLQIVRTTKTYFAVIKKDPLYEHGSFNAPILIDASITFFGVAKERIFIKGDGGPVVDPVLSNGSGSNYLYIYGTDDVDTVELNSVANLLLSGKWIGREGSILELQWNNLDKWVEVGRNEI